MMTEFGPNGSSILNDDETLKQTLIQKKVELKKIKEGDVDVTEVEQDLEQMVEESGSLQAVQYALDYEEALIKLGLTEEFHQLTEEIQSNPDYQHESSEISVTVLKEAKASSEDPGVYFVREFPVRNVVLFQKYILTNPKIIEFVDQYPEQLAELCNMLDDWSALNELSIRYEVVQNILAANDSSPPPSPVLVSQDKEREQSPNVKLPEQMVAASNPEEPPNPPGPWDYEQVEPINLVDVVWPNGDTIHFTPARVITDKEGRERQFYYGELRYKPKDSEEYVDIDLSHFVPGKEVVFEGTEGALTGVTLPPEERKRYGGWANVSKKNDNEDPKFPYLVALNLRCLQESPQSLSTVFHELGHVYLFGDIQKQIVGERSDTFVNKISRLWKKRDDVPEIRGAEHYRRQTDFIKEEVKNNLTQLSHNLDGIRDSFCSRQTVYSLAGKTRESQRQKYLSYLGLTKTDFSGTTMPLISDQELELIKIMVDADQMSRRMNKLLKKGQNLSDKEFGIIQNNLAFRTLSSVFHERNAIAFSIRQLRKLKFREPVDVRATLRHGKGYMNRLSERHSDPRFVRGPKVEPEEKTPKADGKSGYPV